MALFFHSFPAQGACSAIRLAVLGVSLSGCAQAPHSSLPQALEFTPPCFPFPSPDPAQPIWVGRSELRPQPGIYGGRVCRAKSGQKNAGVGKPGEAEGFGFREMAGRRSGGTSHRPKEGAAERSGGHPRIVGEGSGTGPAKEQREGLNLESAPWERCTQRPFEVGDLGGCTPPAGPRLQTVLLSLWDKKAFSSSPKILPAPPLPPSPSLPGRPLLPRTGSAVGFPFPGLSLLLG